MGLRAVRRVADEARKAMATRRGPGPVPRERAPLGVVVSQLSTQAADDHYFARAAVDTHTGPMVQRAIGLEIEVDRPVVNQKGQPLAHCDGKVGQWSSGYEMVEHPVNGLKVVSDTRTFKNNKYSNAELVSEPGAVLPGEDRNFGHSIDEKLAFLEEAHSRLYRPSTESPPEAKTMESLFGDGGYEIKAGYEKSRVAPENGPPEILGDDASGNGLFVHHTVGIPLHGMAEFFRRMLAEEEAGSPGATKARVQENSRAHLSNSLTFGTALGRDYLRSGPSGNLNLDAEEVRGFGALLYNQVMALAERAATEHRKEEKPNDSIRLVLAKNLTAVLSRVDLDVVRQSLSPQAQAFIAEHAEEIKANIMKSYSFAEHEDSESDSESSASDDSSSEAEEEADLGPGDYIDHALHGTQIPRDEDEKSIGAQELFFGGMTELTEPDLLHGVPLFPVELRSFGKRRVNFAGLRSDVGLLSQWSNDVFARAREARTPEKAATFEKISAPVSAQALASAAAAPSSV